MDKPTHYSIDHSDPINDGRRHERRSRTSPERKIRRSRAAVLIGAAVVATSALFGVAQLSNRPETVAAAGLSAEGTSQGTETLVVTADFLNFDIADVSKLPTYKPGGPNSYDPSYDVAVGRYMDAVAREFEGDPGRHYVLAPGDMVDGHWGIDTLGTGTFGPTDTLIEKRDAVVMAGAVYDSAWLSRFRARSLSVLSAPGDHEYGDDPWIKNATGRQIELARKYRMLNTFKDVYSTHFLKHEDGSYRFQNRPPGPANGTAYAFRPSPEVQIVSLDVFRKNQADGTVSIELDDQQLKWLEQVLDKANEDGVDWIMVMNHTPIKGPVRRRNSSGLMYHNPQRLWNLMKREHVDVDLTGEVHADTAIHLDGITQISSGGLMPAADGNYMVIKLRGKRATFITKNFPGAHTVKDGQFIWETDTSKYLPRKHIWYPTQSHETGRMTITSDNKVISRSGLLEPYDPNVPHHHYATSWTNGIGKTRPLGATAVIRKKYSPPAPRP